MELTERVAELERRMAALEEAGGRAAPTVTRADFWALEALKVKLREDGADDGGVLFTGAVRLPAGERYEWQYGLPAEALLDGEWADAADAFAALGHPVRLRLLQEIIGGRRTAAELADLEGLGTTGQIYHHLRQLTAAGWLSAAGRGRYVVPGPRVVPLLVALATARP
ncbi:helix-turn-helix domain-containing protein [Sphaerisporangium sp. TRM90804]|uniref:helix-turn-helix domain-containing protein n=1 Tax=Sphaerisporangium sp. TRM90804 TaxID=3031113 RepID=UPI00244CA554|nr:helix-turn-helix domain-containing protein [Sphaerisporangium sp. TRM90804]MDH2426115.1 helix-turn-helix domain-containing protein [Sphaerisporangium sp. TRM90804]